jgi:hypothetical protein
MFARLSNSWELVKASWAVLRADKELIVFPLVSAAASFIVLITFAIPMLLSGLFEAMFADEVAAARIVGYGVAFVFYLVQYFVIIFFNTALIGAAMIRLDGGDPTVRDGLRIAWEHIGVIFGYAMISATVGLILRWLAQRGVIGRLVSSLIGLAWGMATFLVIPVLVVEDVGPIEGVKRSAKMLRETWGEQIAGNISIGLVFGLLIVLTAVVGVVVTVGLFMLTESIVLIILSTSLFIGVTAVLILISSTLSGIYSAAVYRFAAGKKADLFFSDELVESAFRMK